MNFNKELDDLQYYMDYYTTQLGLKYFSLVVLDSDISYERCAHDKYDIKLNSCKIIYVWKDIKILTFEEFKEKYKEYWKVRFEDRVQKRTQSLGHKIQ